VRALILLVGVAVVGYLYVSAGRSLWDSLRERAAVQRQIAKLQAEYRGLARERALYESRQYVETAARRLGFAFPGEKEYLVGEGAG